MGNGQAIPQKNHSIIQHITFVCCKSSDYKVDLLSTSFLSVTPKFFGPFITYNFRRPLFGFQQSGCLGALLVNYTCEIPCIKSLQNLTGPCLTCPANESPYSLNLTQSQHLVMEAPLPSSPRNHHLESHGRAIKKCN